MAIDNLQSEIESVLRPIHRRLDTLEKQLSAMQGLINQPALRELIRLNDVSLEQAKAQIEELFSNSTDSLHYSDIVEQLSIDVKLVESICDELLDEGKIKYGFKGPRAITRHPKSSPWRKFAGIFAVDPDFDDVVKEMEAYRKEGL